MLAQKLPQDTTEKHMGCLLTLKSIFLLCTLQTTHTHNRIMDSHTQHMAGSKWCLSGYPLQSALIGIHYQSLELGGACFEKVITAKWYNPLHYKSADGILITGELNPEMQSHFPPGENTLQYLCHYSSDAQAAFYLYSSILPVLFGEMKADTDKGGFLCMSIH